MPRVRYFTNGMNEDNGFDDRYLTEEQATQALRAWSIVQDNVNISFSGVAQVLFRYGLTRGYPPRAVGANTANRMVRDGVYLTVCADNPEWGMGDQQIVGEINRNRSGRSRVSVNSSRSQVEQTGVRVSPRRPTHYTTHTPNNGTRRILAPRVAILSDDRFRTSGLRTVGLEIEVNSVSRDVFARNIARSGLASRAAGWGADFRTNAGDVVPDSTVNGGECRGPVVTLDKFQTVYRPIFQAARESNATINRQCGLHCHIGVRGGALLTGADHLDHDAIVRIVSFYHRHTIAIDRFTTADRRSTGNPTWCRAITASDVDNVRDGGTTAHSSAVNTESIQTRGTIEYRQQRGTVNTLFGYAWASLMMSITEMANLDVLPELQYAASIETVAHALLSHNESRYDAVLALGAGRNGDNAIVP